MISEIQFKQTEILSKSEEDENKRLFIEAILSLLTIGVMSLNQKFDIILDDCGHRLIDQILCFSENFKNLKKSDSAKKEIDWIVELISQIRTVRTSVRIPAKAILNLSFKDLKKDKENVLSKYSSFLERLLDDLGSIKKFSKSLSLFIELDIVFQFVKVPPNHLLFT